MLETITPTARRGGCSPRPAGASKGPEGTTIRQTPRQ